MNIECWMKWMPCIPLLWVLAMLVVQTSWFAICFSQCICYSNYLPLSLCRCWISSTDQVRMLGVTSFFIQSIFRWWSTRYIFHRYIISTLAHQWPFGCTDWSQKMMAPVDPSLQVVKSHQVTSIHLVMLGDIVDSEPLVDSHQIISICRLST